MVVISFVNQVFAFATILMQSFTAIAIVYYFVCRSGQNYSIPFFRKFFKFVEKNGITLALVAAAAALLGSLFYSEIAGYDPCKLCWYQRIFMYSQVVVLAVALWKKERHGGMYCLALSAIGAAIAGYHYLMQIGAISSLPCSAVGYSASCSQRFVTQFGYITIPMMSFSVFVLIIVFLLLAKNVKSVE